MFEFEEVSSAEKFGEIRMFHILPIIIIYERTTTDFHVKLNFESFLELEGELCKEKLRVNKKRVIQSGCN